MDNGLLGLKSPWTKVSLGNSPLDNCLLGQLSHWTNAPWTIDDDNLPSADLLDALGYNVNGVPSSMLGRNDLDLLQSNDNNSSYPTGVELPHGKARIHVIKAKELIKSDMIEKSDPYVVLSYGKQNQKTKVVKNTQEVNIHLSTYRICQMQRGTKVEQKSRMLAYINSKPFSFEQGIDYAFKSYHLEFGFELVKSSMKGTGNFKVAGDHLFRGGTQKILEVI